MKSKSRLESEISVAILRFEKEYMGRGPEDIRTNIVGDAILVRERGVLTPAERQLAKSDEGIRLIKEIRVKLAENARDLLVGLIKELTGVEVLALHSDISTSLGERVFVFSLEADLEAALERVRRVDSSAG